MRLVILAVLVVWVTRTALVHGWEDAFWLTCIIGIGYLVVEAVFDFSKDVQDAFTKPRVILNQEVHHEYLKDDPTRPRDEHDGWPAIIEIDRQARRK